MIKKNKNKIKQIVMRHFIHKTLIRVINIKLHNNKNLKNYQIVKVMSKMILMIHKEVIPQ